MSVMILCVELLQFSVGYVAKQNLFSLTCWTSLVPRPHLSPFFRFRVIYRTQIEEEKRGGLGTRLVLEYQYTSKYIQSSTGNCVSIPFCHVKELKDVFSISSLTLGAVTVLRHDYETCTTSSCCNFG